MSATARKTDPTFNSADRIAQTKAELAAKLGLEIQEGGSIFVPLEAMRRAQLNGGSVLPAAAAIAAPPPAPKGTVLTGDRPSKLTRQQAIELAELMSLALLDHNETVLDVDLLLREFGQNIELRSRLSDLKGKLAERREALDQAAELVRTAIFEAKTD